MKISKSTIERLKKDYDFSFYGDIFLKEVPPKHANEIEFNFEIVDGQQGSMMHKTIKTPKKKEVTYAWIMEQLNKGSIYYNFCKEFNAFLREHGLRGYPTSYGIGIEAIFSRQQDLKDKQDAIGKKLNKFGIKFKTEYSGQKWVFRYKISKSKENIETLKRAFK